MLQTLAHHITLFCSHLHDSLLDVPGHENRLEPDYVNQDEIDRVGANTTHHTAPSSSRTHSRNAGNLHIVTSTPSSRSTPSSPTHSGKLGGRDPSMSPRAQVQTVHSQVGG